MNLADFFQSSDFPIGMLDKADAQIFSDACRPLSLAKGNCAAQQGYPDDAELILMSGQIVSHVSDSDGRQVCVDLFLGPCVITPHVARSADGTSLVTLEVTKDAELMHILRDTLEGLMVESSTIRAWGNDVLRQTLTRKAAREWCLCALRGKERLAWFRDTYVGYEAQFGHKHIASFLGLTPVSLSRLRADTT